jgi:hypothetical protein
VAVRAFALILALGLVLAFVFLTTVLVTTLRRGAVLRQRRRASWRVRHYTEGEFTIVAVGLATPGGPVLDEHVVVRLPDSEPDWQQRFLLARQEAEERAFHLNADRGA